MRIIGKAICVARSWLIYPEFAETTDFCEHGSAIRVGSHLLRYEPTNIALDRDGAAANDGDYEAFGRFGRVTTQKCPPVSTTGTASHVGRRSPRDAMLHACLV